MKPFVLTILDGWGYSKEKHGNAILNAKTPNLNSIQENYPSLLLQASGKAVGITWGETGNSEVGHLTIGAGRVVFQYLSRINKAISNGVFFENEAFKKAVNQVKTNNSTLHLVGLLTSGSVHAYLAHLFALIDLAAKNQISNVKIHLFADGKDSGLKETPLLIKKLQDYITKAGVGTIATIIGRDFPMDRTKNWDYTKKTYDLLVNGGGEKIQDIFKKLQELYDVGITDSKLPPLILDKTGLFKENDAVIFFNFREDSMRQIVRSFVEQDFNIFPVEYFKNIFVVMMTQYLDDPQLNVAFPIPKIKNGLAEVLSLSGKNQFHLAETEKFAHITYFFNCLNNTPYDGETDVYIDSLKNNTESPIMRASEITDKIIPYIENEQYDFYVLNFANADVLAHLGNLEVTVKGVETIDEQIGKLMDAVLKKDGIMIITADHGNAESLTYQSTGEMETRHNDNPVPFYLVGKNFERLRSDEDVASTMDKSAGLLSDVAPTVLELMGIEKPVEMTGDSLLKLLST